MDLRDIRFRVIQYNDVFLARQLQPVDAAVDNINISRQDTVGSFINVGATCNFVCGDNELIVFYDSPRIMIFNIPSCLAHYIWLDNMVFIPSRIDIVCATTSIFHIVNICALANVDVISYLEERDS